jgi:hypothetical protein
MDRQTYLNEWKKLPPLVITMTGKFGRCNHELGERYVLRSPYDRPAGLCSALWHVLEFYAWRATLGFPSWEPDDETVYRLHCPCETGTVWELRKAGPGELPAPVGDAGREPTVEKISGKEGHPS